MFNENQNTMKILNIGRLGIRKQVSYLLLSCSIITLLIAGSAALYGMFRVKSDAVSVGMEIGESAAKTGSDALKKSAEAAMQGIVHERSGRINNFFDDFAGDVRMLQNEMSFIMHNPQYYPPRTVNPPDRKNAGKVTPQLQFRAGLNPASVAYEVGLMSNLQDFMVRLYDNDDTIASNYVASKNGFDISVDRASDKRVDANNVPIPNDYRVRPWYKNALEAKSLTFTEIFADSLGRGLAIGCAAPYLDANGEIAGVVGEGKLMSDVDNIVKNTKFGETGFAFTLNNRTGQVINSPKFEGAFGIDYDNNLSNDPSLFDYEEPSLAETAKKMAAGETGFDLVKFDGKNYYVAYAPIKNTWWSFGVAVEEDEIISAATLNTHEIESTTGRFVDSLNNSIKFVILAMIVVFIGLIALFSFAGRKVAEKFTAPLQVLTDGVRDIASGNWDNKIEVHTGNELEHLAVCFNAMTDELKKYTENLTKVTAEKERIATELNVATEIQASMLPTDFPLNEKISILATMHPAKEVGGDFYDFYFLDENHLMITIADVSGKGVPAALFMVISKTILKNFALTMTGSDDISAVVTCTNRQLCQNNDAMMFVTAFVGMLEINTGKFTFVNAGHNPPMIYRKNENRAEYLEVKKNKVLGVMAKANFAQQEIRLNSGDMIFMYTDGVTEAMNEAGDQYTPERLDECLNGLKISEMSLEEILSAVKKSLNEHVKDAEQSDDITMMTLKIS